MSEAATPVPLRFLLRQARREARGSLARAAFFAACLSVGVAAVVAVAGLSDGLDRTIRGKARELLGADIAVEANRALPPELDAAIAAIPGARRADTRELATVAAAPGRGDTPGRSLLVALRAVTPEFPFYGAVTLERPEAPFADLLAGGETVVVAPDVLGRLGLQRGGTLLIGGRPYRIAGVVTGEPGGSNPAFALGPRVFISAEGLDRAGLVTMGSRVRYKALVRLPDPEAGANRGGGPAAAARAAEDAAASIKAALPHPERVEVETFAQAQPGLREGLTRVERFLGLVALLSLLIGGIGVAQAVRAWLASRMDGIAILACLGVRPREILALYVGQTAVLGLCGSVVGAALGIALTAIVPELLLRGLVPAGAIDPWQPFAVLRGLALGVGVALAFSVPPLVALRRIPPVLVLRRDAEPLPSGRVAPLAAALVLVAGVFGAAAVQSGSALRGALFTAGLIAATLALAASAWATARTVGRGARRVSRVWVRHGLAALARPGAGTLGAIVALGLGVLVVLGMHLVESRLRDQFGADVPKDAPTYFLIDVQPDQWEPLQRTLAAEGAEGVDSAPVITGRLTAVNGTPVEELSGDLRRGGDAPRAADAPPEGDAPRAADAPPEGDAPRTADGPRTGDTPRTADAPRIDAGGAAPGAEAASGAAAATSTPAGRDERNADEGRRIAQREPDDAEPDDAEPDDAEPDRERRWSLTREQRITYRGTLPRGNTLVEGTLWSDPQRAEASIEEEFAKNLGVGVGGTLTFEIQGVPVEVVVTSLRRVEWRTFGINFFLVVEPGVLDDAPQFRVVTFRLPRERDQAVQDRLAREYPNITPIRLREIVDKVAEILGQLGLAVRVLGGFTVLAGIAILGGAVSAGSSRRGREVALLKTIGMTRRGVISVFAVEYALVGLVAGTIGAAAAGVLAWAVLERGLDLPAQLGPWPFAAAIAAAVALSVLAGLAASVTALARRPVEVLRAE